MSRAELVIIIVLLSCIIALICPLIIGRGEKRVSWVGLQMWALRAALENYQGDYGELPDLAPSPNGERENAAIISILAARTNDSVAAQYNPQHFTYMNFRADTSTKGELLDPWKHPYHIAWANKATDQNSASKKVRVSDSIRIWSDGPNGRNENGAGDDPHSWR
jgi:hypothetical protein